MTEQPYSQAATGDMPSAAPPNMLTAALRYAGAGVSVFPVNGKAPLTEHGFHDATTDREQVEAWWAEHPDAGIGTPDFDAVDVDLYKPECAPTWEQIRPLIPEGDTVQPHRRQWPAVLVQSRNTPRREDRPRR